MSHQIKIKSFGPPINDTIKIFLTLGNGIFTLKLIYVALIIPKCLSLQFYFVLLKCEIFCWLRRDQKSY